MLNCLLVMPLVVLAELISGCREGVYHYNPVIIVNKTLEHLERGIREFCRSRISSSGTVPWLVGDGESEPTSKRVMPMALSCIAAPSWLTLNSKVRFSFAIVVKSMASSPLVTEGFCWD